MKHKKLIAFSLIGLLLVSGFLWLGHKKLYQMWRNSIIEDVCTKHYQRVATSPFDVVGFYDGDGFGSCIIYVQGVRVDTLDCDAAFFMNTGSCRATKFGFAGGTSGE
jgi:hypothetical protein